MTILSQHPPGCVCETCGTCETPPAGLATPSASHPGSGFEVHPAAAELPPITGAEFDDLVADIRVHGLQQPIVLHEGRILDGVNRYRACLFAGVEPRFVTWEGQCGSLAAFVASQNLYRRHLTTGQRAIFAAREVPGLVPEARERQGRRNDLVTSRQDFRDVPAGDARDIAGKHWGVSGRYVSDAKAVLEGAPDLADAVAAGTRTLPAATRELRERTGMARKAALFTSESDEWATPQDFFDRLDAEFQFTLDPCATAENAKVSVYFTAADDGLSRDWSGHRAYVNPPYGKTIGRWVQKACESARAGGALVVALIPSRTDTAWWHEHVMGAEEIRFVRGRLRFGDGSGVAPFPSAVVVWRAEGSSGPPVVSSMPARSEAVDEDVPGEGDE